MEGYDSVNQTRASISETQQIPDYTALGKKKRTS